LSNFGNETPNQTGPAEALGKRFLERKKWKTRAATKPRVFPVGAVTHEFHFEHPEDPGRCFGFPCGWTENVAELHLAALRFSPGEEKSDGFLYKSWGNGGAKQWVGKRGDYGRLPGTRASVSRVSQATRHKRRSAVGLAPGAAHMGGRQHQWPGRGYADDLLRTLDGAKSTEKKNQTQND